MPRTPLLPPPKVEFATLFSIFQLEQPNFFTSFNHPDVFICFCPDVALKQRVPSSVFMFWAFHPFNGCEGPSLFPSFSEILRAQVGGAETLTDDGVLTRRPVPRARRRISPESLPTSQHTAISIGGSGVSAAALRPALVSAPFPALLVLRLGKE